MVDKRIEDYIATNKAKGFSAGQLYTALVNQGYNAGQVAEALRPHHQVENKHHLSGKILIFVGILMILMVIAGVFFVLNAFSPVEQEVVIGRNSESAGVIASRGESVVTQPIESVIVEDLCEGVVCREGEQCFEGECFRKSCSELGGQVCGGGSSCDGSLKVGSDTNLCCVGGCIIDDVCGDVDCDSGEVCKEGSCVALSCSELKGVVCSPEQLCVGRLGSDCCTSCNERTDSCTGVSCNSNEACQSGQCVVMSCSDQGGVLCGGDETCIDELTASDAGVCCSGSCEEPIVEEESTDKEFIVTAKQFSFLPERIEVNQGDSVTLKITSEDVDHGLFLGEFGVQVTLPVGEEVVVTFVADQVGEFTIHCSVFCGSGHNGMTGTLVVS
jgi:cytochrome c oxidase subunit 2